MGWGIQLAEASSCEHLWSELFKRVWSTKTTGLSQPQLSQYNRHHAIAVRRFAQLEVSPRGERELAEAIG